MTDSSSQNPFDPVDKPDSGFDSSSSSEDQSKSRLKLKQLLTPLSPHLHVEGTKKDERFDEFRPKMEIPRAVPMDPEPELAPHERPPSLDGTPLPPVDAQFGQGGQPNGGGHPMLHPDDSHSMTADPAQEDQEEEIVELVSAPGRETGKFKKVALTLLAVLVVAAGVQYFFDPLGLSIDPIPNNDAVVLKEASAAPVTEQLPASIAPVTLSLELDRITVDSFLEILEKQVIIHSQNPHGAIIDSVFYAEGISLNPRLGLVLSSVTDASITVTDSTGKQYELPVD